MPCLEGAPYHVSAGEPGMEGLRDGVRDDGVGGTMGGVSKEAPMQVTNELVQELDAKSYDELVAQHQAFEKRLQELTSKTWLTP